MALLDGQPAGCGALRPLRDVDYSNACEMKRLYVPRAFRRFGLGRLIAQQLIDLAMQAGYSTLLLDTLDDMVVGAREAGKVDAAATRFFDEGRTEKTAYLAAMDKYHDYLPIE